MVHGAVAGHMSTTYSSRSSVYSIGDRSVRAKLPRI
jgi:hypothetical protein